MLRNPPPPPQNPAQQQQRAARDADIERFKRQRFAALARREEQMRTGRVTRYVSATDANKSPQELLEEARKAGKDPLAMGYLTTNSNDDLLTTPGIYTSDGKRKIVVDNQGRISLIPPPEVRFRLKHKEWLLGAALTHRFMPTPKIPEMTGKKQTALDIGILGFFMLSTFPLIPATVPILALFAGNSYKEIINGHREVMRIMKTHQGRRDVTIGWKKDEHNNPYPVHKKVLLGMLNAALAEGLAIKFEPKLDEHGRPIPKLGPDGAQLFGPNGEPLYLPGKVEEFIQSQKDSDKYMAIVRKANARAVANELTTMIGVNPLFEKDANALNAIPKLDGEQGNTPQEKSDAYRDRAIADPAAPGNPLAGEQKVAAIDAELSNLDSLIGTLEEKDLSQVEAMHKSFEALLNKPEQFLEAPPLEHKSWRTSVKEFFTGKSEDLKDPEKAVAMLESRFTLAKGDVDKNLAAREKVQADIKEKLGIWRNELAEQRNAIQVQPAPQNAPPLTPQQQQEIKKIDDALNRITALENKLQVEVDKTAKTSQRQNGNNPDSLPEIIKAAKAREQQAAAHRMGR